MSGVTDHDVTETMILYGGAFVTGLGELYRRADDENQQRLRDAFPEYFKQYRELAELRQRRLAAAEREP